MKNKAFLSILLCLLGVQVSAQISPSSPQVCAGSKITVSDHSAGTGWTSDDPTIASITTGVTTATVTGVSGGTTNISFTATGDFVTVTVNTVSPITVSVSSNSPNPACGYNGSSITLTDATSGGTWSGNFAGQSSISSGGVAPLTPFVTPDGAGVPQSAKTATFSYTSSAGCVATIVVTDNPSPKGITITYINGAGLYVCFPSGTANVSDITTGGSWSSSDVTIGSYSSISGNTAVVQGVGAGTATLTYALSTGCLTTAALPVHASPALITGRTTICPSGTTTLTDVSGDVSAHWFSSNMSIASVGQGTLSTTVTAGASTGTALITYAEQQIFPSGCYASTVVYVGTGPVSGTLSVCQGSTTALTDANPGGEWSSSNTAIGTIGSSSGIFYGVLTGATTIATVNVSYLVQGANTCSATATVTVNPLPSSITGTLTVCVGSTTSLTDAGGGTWSSSNTTVGTVDASGNVMGLSTGTTTITYTLGTGCITTAVVTVNVVPNINGTALLCQGSVSQLTDDEGGGTWSSTNTGVGTIGTGGIVRGISNGTTTISYIIGPGCAATLVVTVNATTYPVECGESASVVGFNNLSGDIVNDVVITSYLVKITDGTNTVNRAQTTPMTLATGGSFQPIPITNVIDDGYPGFPTGWSITGVKIFSVTYNGCQWTDSIPVCMAGNFRRASSASTALASAEQSALAVIPNPNDGTFTITGTFPGSSKEVTIEVVDILGKTVYSDAAIIQNGAINKSMALDNINNGIYLIKVTSDNATNVIRCAVSR